MTILFDSAACVKPVSFGTGLLPVRKSAPVPAPIQTRKPFTLTGLTLAETREIDGIRLDAFHMAIGGGCTEDEAGEYAADVAVDALRKLYARKQLDHMVEAIDNRRAVKKGHKPYTGADAAWWTGNAPSNAYGFETIGQADAILEHAAGSAMAQARLDAGFTGCF